MIKARYTSETGEETILLGIDAENVKRLKDQKPILVRGAELDIDYDIWIVYGDTLEEIVDKYRLPSVQ